MPDRSPLHAAPRHLTLGALAALALAACSDRAPVAPADVGEPSAARGGEPGAPLVRANGRGQRPIPDQYIVVFKPGTGEARGLARAMARAHGSEPLHVYDTAVRGFAAKLNPKAVEALRKNPNVLFIEQDQLDELPAPDDEPEAIDQENLLSWGLDRIDQRDRPLDTKYAYANDGTGIRVYIIDSGIRYDHQEFGGRASLGVDYVGDGVGAAVGDCNGHGTHVAGTVGGVRSGVAKNVQLVNVRVFPCTGGSPRSRTIASVNWVTANGVKPAVVNMSLGGNNEGFPGMSTLDMAVEASIAAGFVYAVAAGNEGTDACTRSPARAPSAITIGSIRNVTVLDSRALSSNYGSCVDLFAPGQSITSATWQNSTGFRTISGTSMAAPHVAGAAALHLQLRPSATPAQVAATILANAAPNRVSDERGSPNLLLNTIMASPVDIRPGSDENPVNLRAGGELPVAVLSTAEFDATQLDPATVTLGDEQGSDTPVTRRRNGTWMASAEDVNLDGRMDMVLHVAVPQLVANGDLGAASTRLVLNGRKRDAWPFRGADVVRIVP